MSSSGRKLGPVLATFVVAGNMIGSGIFLLPAVLAETGSASLIGWAIAALGAALLAAVFALLGMLRPAREDLTEYPANGLHPAAGFAAWLAYWISCWVGNVAILLAAIGYIGTLIPGDLARSGQIILLLILIWALAIANIAGARRVGWFAGATLAVGLLPIIAAIALGIFHFDSTLFAQSWNVSGDPLNGAIPPIVLTIFWAFLGLESANAIAPVIQQPNRNVAISAIGGVLLAAVVYALACAVLFGALPAADLSASSAPFADVVAHLAGTTAGAFIAVAAITRIIGCAGGWFLVSAQTSRSGAEAGYLPALFGREARADRPTRNILLVAILMTLVVFATLSPTLNSQFLMIVDFSVLLFMAVYAMCALSLIRFAGSLTNRRHRRLARILGWTAVIFCLAVAAGSV